MHEHRDSLRRFPTPRTPFQRLGGVEHLPHINNSAIFVGLGHGSVEALPRRDFFRGRSQMMAETIFLTNENHCYLLLVYILYHKECRVISGLKKRL
jgi:hypothetical protein